jgi:iron complex outermembrane receptor protein
MLTTNITLYQITNSNLAQTAEFKADGTTVLTKRKEDLVVRLRAKVLKLILLRPFEGST